MSKEKQYTLIATTLDNSIFVSQTNKETDIKKALSAIEKDKNLFKNFKVYAHNGINYELVSTNVFNKMGF